MSVPLTQSLNNYKEINPFDIKNVEHKLPNELYQNTHTYLKNFRQNNE